MSSIVVVLCKENSICEGFQVALQNLLSEGREKDQLNIINNSKYF